MTAALLVTRDDLLTAEVVRLAAAAGVEPVVVREVGDALRSWSGAGPVLVGADLAEPLSQAGPPRRPQVYVVGHSPVPDHLFKWALEIGAETLAALPVSEGWLVEMLTDAGDATAAAQGRLVGVLGGSGGAGATVFACALAQSLAASGSTLLVDADPWGAGVDRVLGAESEKGVRWDSLVSSTGRLSARALKEALPTRRGVAVLGWPAPAGPAAVVPDGPALPQPVLQPFAMREVLSAGCRGHDTTVLDLPRHPGQATDEALARCHRVVLVTGCTVAAVTSASRTATRLRGHSADLHVVVRGTGGVSADHVGRLLGADAVVAMTDQRGLDEAIDLGAGPLRARRGPLARAAAEVAATIAGLRVAA
ncbi:ATPase AAA [Marmoricola endophyticus]|uniref:ATPase AAA n=1 Tax=Marmoricola endophyticus TaxID=2040280 RepID=A0A917BKJ9_9ACTN|nr:septum site-determining protein Ssd [Marmoricola endophyticus]GGF49522.1 ATPase AAA [Marmoricola endophyticus]